MSSSATEQPPAPLTGSPHLDGTHNVRGSSGGVWGRWKLTTGSLPLARRALPLGAKGAKIMISVMSSECPKLQEPSLPSAESLSRLLAVV